MLEGRFGRGQDHTDQLPAILSAKGRGDCWTHDCDIPATYVVYEMAVQKRPGDVPIQIGDAEFCEDCWKRLEATGKMSLDWQFVLMGLEGRNN